MKRDRQIVLLTGSHLCNNPRTLKEADALSAAGWDVEVLGWIASREQAKEDAELMASRRWRFTPCANLLASDLPSRVRHLYWRVVRRGAFAAARLASWRTTSQLGGWRHEILRIARSRRAALYIAHSGLTLWVAHRLLSDGCRVGADMEDWFSRDQDFPFPSDRIRESERAVLCRAIHSTTTSHALAAALEEAHGCSRPAVIYNAFPWADRAGLDGQQKDRRDPAGISLHWYSQTLGAGRGLDDLLRALPHVKSRLEVHLRGTPAAGFETWLAGQVAPAWRDRVHTHAVVSNHELLSRIAEHDIGFAGETALQPARALTVSNKMMQYLLAGLAIVASDTSGQREIAAAAPGAIELYPSGDERALAAQIDALAGNTDRLRRAREAALAAARTQFNWEAMADRLVASVERAAAIPVPSAT